jgi:hypothetical protein
MMRSLLTIILIEGEDMQTRSRITKLIVITMAVAALAASLLCQPGWLKPVEAQSGDGSVRFVSYTCIGIVPRQKLRISVANPEESATNRFVYMYYTVSNPSGDHLYESERIPVPSGEFRSSDISYTGLEVAGEPGRGRVQMMVKLVVELPTGIDPSHAIGSLELIDEETGGTVAIIKVKRIKEMPEPTP